MSNKGLISELASKGLLDDETVKVLNDDLGIELKKEIEYYKNISYRKGLNLIW